MRFILFLLTLCSLQTAAQVPCSAFQHAFQAEQYYRSQPDLNRAVELYIQAFASGLKDASVLLNAITCATQANDSIAAVKLVEYGLAIGLTTYDYVRLWNHIGGLFDFNQLICKVDTVGIVNAYKNSLQHGSIHQLHVMAQRDQQYRSEDTDLAEMQRANDSINWHELKSLTQSLGRLPSYSEIGLEGSDDMELILYHMEKNELQWFLPFIIQAIREGSNLGHVVLYQLDRIGIEEGRIFRVTNDRMIEDIGARTRLKSGISCQTYGEWFAEQNMDDNEYYFTPIDPQVSLIEVNRIRNLFCLDDIESKWKRTPWVKVVSISEFEEKFK